MSYKILEKNGVDNQNVDGGAFNNFAAGGRDGIVGGVLAECALTAAGSAIGISPGLIILHGIRIKVTGIETLALSSVPLNPTSYQIVAQVTLASNGDVDFSFFIRTPQPLVQNSLYKSDMGTYQAELASFTHNPDGTISDLIRTMDTIYGAGGGEVNLEVGTVTTETIAAGLDAEFNVDVRHEDATNKTYLDFDAKIPRGESGTDAGAVHFNEEQTLTDEQKEQARENIDAASTNGNFPDFHAGYAEKDEQGNPFPTTYAKATIVPVRWNGGYWSSYGGQSAKAGDLALIIDNTGSTGYQKGCLYKVSSASGSSMSLSPTRIADWVSAQAGALNGSIDMGKNDITFSTEDPGDLVWAQDGSTENARIYYDNINEMLILRAASGSDIVGGKVTVNGSLYEKDHKVVTENKIKSYIAFNGENPAELFGGTWEDFSYQVPLQDNFYIDFTGKSYTYNLNNAFDTVKSCALICITCTSAGEKARGIWAYTPSAGHNYQGKQLAEISVTNGYDGNTISVSVASGAGNVLSVNTSFSGTWRLTVIPLQAADQLAVLWKRLS